jgi:hypothetical protein
LVSELGLWSVQLLQAQTLGGSGAEAEAEADGALGGGAFGRGELHTRQMVQLPALVPAHMPQFHSPPPPPLTGCAWITPPPEDWVGRDV